MILPLLAIASEVIADQAPAGPTSFEPDIVVSARERSIGELAAAITPNLASDSPIGRFSSQICFEVLGLRADYAASMRLRLVKNARSAGASLADTPCSPNALVIFVEDGRAELADIAARRPHLLDGLSDLERSRLMADPGPARAWVNSAIRGSDGQQIGPDLRLRGAVMSRIVLSIRRDLLSSVVLIDTKATESLSLQQVADYASMRLLAETRSDSVNDPATILSLFNVPRGTAPRGLTRFDRAYLRACYSGLGNERGRTKLARIASMLREGK